MVNWLLHSISATHEVIPNSTMLALPFWVIRCNIPPISIICVFALNLIFADFMSFLACNTLSRPKDRLCLGSWNVATVSRDWIATRVARNHLWPHHHSLVL